MNPGVSGVAQNLAANKSSQTCAEWAYAALSKGCNPRKSTLLLSETNRIPAALLRFLDLFGMLPKLFSSILEALLIQL